MTWNGERSTMAFDNVTVLLVPFLPQPETAQGR